MFLFCFVLVCITLFSCTRPFLSVVDLWCREDGNALGIVFGLGEQIVFGLGKRIVVGSGKQTVFGLEKDRIRFEETDHIRYGNALVDAIVLCLFLEVLLLKLLGCTWGEIASAAGILALFMMT